MLDKIDQDILEGVARRGADTPSITDVFKAIPEQKSYNSVRDRIYDLERQGLLQTEKRRDRVLVRLVEEGHVATQTKGA